jgi:thymidine kinase
MFSGKTTALIRDTIIHPGLVIDYNIGIFHSTLSNHNDTTIPCISVSNLSDVDASNFNYIYINEAQFFPDLMVFVLEMLRLQKNVYVYGLDGDFKQQKFGSILDLIPFSDTYTKLYAQCANCGSNASFSKRLTVNNEQFAPHDAYIPVCRRCL